MPGANFAKDITSIFNSELPLCLKYDVTCRLVCETLQSATVSMLVYDGQSDKLKCKGSYINPDRLGCDFYGNQELRAVIKDIAIYEFIYYYRKKGNEAARFADF